MKKNSVYNNAVSVKDTPVTQPIFGSNQKPNNGGGYSFVIDEMARLDRFLILGSDSPTYYTDEKELTKQNVTNVVAAIKKNGVAVVNRVAEISEAGRAPKNDPALLVLALAMTQGNAETQNAAVQVFSRVARIGTHLLTFAGFIDSMKGWNGKNPPARRAVTKWFNEKTGKQLADQLTKYANRNGWTNGDVLRLSHVRPSTPTHDALFAYALGKEKTFEEADVAEYMNAIAEIKRLKVADDGLAAHLISDHRLPREVIPTELLNSKLIWEALLPHMGITAMVRNLAKMTNVGLIGPLSEGRKVVLDKLGDVDVLRKSRIHPLQLLTAFLTYKQGHGTKGSLTWTPEQKVLDALDEAFYASFANIVPTGKNIVLAVDISGSMGMVGWSYSDRVEMMGVPGLTPRVAAALFAMLFLRTEENTEVVGFSNQLIRLALSPKMRMDAVVAEMSRYPFGSTDASLPFSWAANNKIDAEGFYVMTDNEVNTGKHPAQVLKKYRQDRGIPAKLVVAGFTATEFSIADPNDGGMLDVVGFDSAAPAIMTDFIRG